MTARNPKLLVIVPLYRAPELIEGLFESLRSVADEVVELGARILFINDSPDDPGLSEALASATAAGLAGIDFELIGNTRNLGFVETSNRGLRQALEMGADALLMNSDVLVAPGALREIVEVAKSDPLIAVVSPRSNNATICNSPYGDRFRDYDYAEARAAHEAIVRYLPRVSYVPTAVGFCLYIRHGALEEFGLLDEVYGGGYNEENDFIMRCSRRGHRAVLANRAFVYHLGSISFEQSGEGRSPREIRNRKILDDRYPEYTRATERYYEGTDYLSQRLCSELLPDRQGRRSILFDCRNIGPYHNGTFELTKRLLSAFAAQYHDTFAIFVSCEEGAYEFHALDTIDNIEPIFEPDLEARYYGFAVRIAQPFSWHDLVEICGSAPISSFVMLDTIAMDCLNLDEQGLEALWRQMLNMASAVGFISQFSRDEFVRRLPLPASVTDFVTLCSTDVADYASAAVAGPPKDAERSILIIGNHFAHKNIRATVEHLRTAAKTHRIVVLGIDLPDEPDIASYKSGHLSNEAVDRLYAAASVVLFPSHNEGFGFPIMHALARHRPIVARNLPIFEEIRERTALRDNIHLCDSTRAMVDLALTYPAWQPERHAARPAQTWDRAAADLHDGLMRALSAFDARDLRRRLDGIDLCRKRLEAVEEADAAWLGRDQSQRARSVARTAATVRKARTVRSVSTDLLRRASWDAARLGRRLPFPRRPNAEDVLTALGALPEGPRLTLTSGRIDRLPVDAPSRVIFARDHLDAYSVRDLCIRLLEVSDRLAVGGVLFFAVSVAMRRQTLPIDAGSPRGVVILCANAGLRVTSVETVGPRIMVAAEKVRPWLDLAEGGDDERFVRDLYRAAFRRDIDEAGSVHVRALQAGASRASLAKRLFSSAERIGILTRSGARPRFGSG
ncbi:glycosyltransferase [Methylobacterium planeticum]|uniref:Glycosyltransferase n=1 Tax=Methylobacterium planeticum TaxID=2615211 RepID=A0A6N6MS19_9HYPH|nr:glycosyltransferase [Methylobacterium planeticum]KAB1073646.1 glycosyltransferase [Methylobacterium planeticum]